MKAWPFILMVVSTLVEGFYGSWRGRELHSNPTLTDGLVNTAVIVSYWVGFLWITLKNKNNEKTNALK